MTTSIGANLLLLMKKGGSSTPSRKSEQSDNVKPVKNFNMRMENLQEIDRIIEEDDSLKEIVKPPKSPKSPYQARPQRKGWGNV